MMSARAVNVLKYSLLLTPFVLLPIVSCNGGGGGGGGGNAVQNALLACGLITAGTYGEEVGSDPFDICLSQCLAGGTCAALEDLVCDFGPAGEALFNMCYTQCIQAHGHGCDGETIPPFSICDGFEDCADGSDELDCPPPFTCGDGSEIPPNWQCDGEADCQDASDENGCASTLFTCGDGEQIPKSWQCDLEEDCNDGSDELGCAMLLCPDDGGSETIDTFTTAVSTEGGFDTGGFDTGTSG